MKPFPPFRILFLFCLLFFSLVRGLDLPQNPSTPAVPLERKKTQEGRGLLSLKCRVVFYRPEISFTGTIFLPDFTLKLISEKKGFRFFKELSLREIKKITVQEWLGTEYSQKDGAYVFYPRLYRIEDRNGVSFNYPGNIPQLNQFAFETKWGKTKFFSYFFDYWKKNRWEMTGRTEKKMETSQALEKVVVMLEFSDEKKEHTKTSPKANDSKK